MSGRGGAGVGTLTSVPGLRVGHADDREARTGCTVVLGPFRAAVEVRGLATGSRELDALSPLHVVPRCDAVLLTGGSAFGLAAADGVVAWLEERGRGFPTSAATVPIVPAAVLYDLAVGDPSVRPGPAMGRAAAEAANDAPVPEGPVGAGCGATVGKLRGGGSGDPSGVGSWADDEAGPAVAALAAVNAFGDVVDAEGGILAGARDEDGELLDTARALRSGRVPPGFGRPRDEGAPAAGPDGDPFPGGGAAENTTLAVVATDAPLDRGRLRVVARQAMNGLVRRVRPAATPFDGDMVFALSTAGEAGDLPAAEVLRVAVRAEAALERAVERAVRRGDGGPS
jgi:L-aminopeptidase/D-esterase-like protein